MNTSGTKKTIFTLILMLVAMLTPTVSAKGMEVNGNTVDDYIDKHTMYWDITNDGKDDMIEFLPIEGQNSLTKYDSLSVNINGVPALTLNGHEFDIYYAIDTIINGKHYLILQLYGLDNCGPAGLYEYDNTKLKIVLKFTDTQYADSVNKYIIKGNRIITDTTANVPGLGVAKYRSVYSLKKNSSFKVNPKRKILLYTHNTSFNYKGKLVTNRNVDIYRDYKGKSLKGTIPKGTSVKVVECYFIKKHVALHLKSTKYDGWYVTRRLKPSKLYDIIFEDCYYGG